MKKIILLAFLSCALSLSAQPNRVPGPIIVTGLGGTDSNTVYNIVNSIISSMTNYSPTFYVTNLFVTTNYNNYQYTTNQYVTTNYTEVSYVTNLYVTTNYVNYEFVTNLYSTTNFNEYSYITNLFSSNAFITNLFVTTNFNEYSYVTNLFVTTNYNNYQFVTNQFVTTNYTELSYITNLFVTTNYNEYAYITNLYSIKNSVVNLYAFDTTITNGLYFHTNNWAGPTNTLDMRLQKQSYRTFTPMEITGLLNRSNYVAQSVVLTFTNASDSNVTLYLPTTVKTGDGTRVFVVTNAAIGVISLEYDPSIGTNAVTRNFW